jgi:hypothetical protein
LRNRILAFVQAGGVLQDHPRFALHCGQGSRRGRQRRTGRSLHVGQ